MVPKVERTSSIHTIAEVVFTTEKRERWRLELGKSQIR